MTNRRAASGRTERTVWLLLALALVTVVPSTNTWKPTALQVVLSSALAASLLLCSRLTSGRRALEALDGHRQRLTEALLEPSPMLFSAAVFAIELVAASACSLLLFDGLPHIQDSACQLFHGRIFAHGMLAAPPPPLPEFFQHTFMLTEPRWYSQYPPGHSLSLAVGVLSGATWIVNPLLGATSVTLFYWIGREMFDEITGRVAALLGLLSPMILLMSSEYMNHATALCGFCLFLLGFVRAVGGSTAWGIVAGLGLGWMFAARPLTAVALSVPFALYSARRLLDRDARQIRSLLALAGTVLACASAVLWFNHETNGDATTFGYEKLHGDSQSLGFGKGDFNRADTVPHSPARGLANTRVNLNALNFFLLRWPVPALLFVPFAFGLTSSQRPWSFLLLASLGTLAGAYFFYWYHDLTFGPRNIYEAGVAVLLLVTRGILQLPRHLSRLAGLRAAELRGLTTALTALCIAFGALVWVPLELRGHARSDLHGEDVSFYGEVEAMGLQNALVFVSQENWRGVFPQNSPELDGAVVFAHDLGERNRELMAIFPNRQAYLEVGGVLEPLAAGTSSEPVLE